MVAWYHNNSYPSQSPIRCTISASNQCPNGYSCQSDVPGAFQGYCCSASPVCPNKVSGNEMESSGYHGYQDEYQTRTNSSSGRILSRGVESDAPFVYRRSLHHLPQRIHLPVSASPPFIFPGFPISRLSGTLSSGSGPPPTRTLTSRLPSATSSFRSTATEFTTGFCCKGETASVSGQ